MMAATMLWHGAAVATGHLAASATIGKSALLGIQER